MWTSLQFLIVGILWLYTKLFLTSNALENRESFLLFDLIKFIHIDHVE